MPRHPTMPHDALVKRNLGGNVAAMRMRAKASDLASASPGSRSGLDGMALHRRVTTRSLPPTTAVTSHRAAFLL